MRKHVSESSLSNIWKLTALNWLPWRDQHTKCHKNKCYIVSLSICWSFKFFELLKYIQKTYVNSTRSNNFNEHFTIRELYFCLEWPKKKKRPHSVSWQQTHQTSGWQPWWRWYHPHGKSIHHNLNSDVLFVFVCFFKSLELSWDWFLVTRAPIYHLSGRILL